MDPHGEFVPPESRFAMTVAQPSSGSTQEFEHVLLSTIAFSIARSGTNLIANAKPHLITRRR